MKKLILLLFIPLVFACSSDDSANENLDNLTPKVVTWTREKSYCQEPYLSYNIIYENDKVIGGNVNSGNSTAIPCTTDGFIVYSFTVAYQNDLIFSINTQGEIMMGESDNSSNLVTYDYNEDGLIIARNFTYYEDNIETGNSVQNFEWTNNNLILSTYYQDGSIAGYTEFDNDYNKIQIVTYSETGEQCITSYQTNYDVLVPPFPDGLFGVAPESRNGFISIHNSCDNVTKYFDYEVNENGFASSVTSTRSDDPDYYSTTRYYYE